jgi:hypothetical protein
MLLNHRITCTRFFYILFIVYCPLVFVQGSLLDWFEVGREFAKFYLGSDVPCYLRQYV